MEGNINLPGSPHYLFHQYLERQFWDDYRDEGKFFGEMPTNAQYGRVLKRAFLASGSFTPVQASHLAREAAAERAANGLDEAAPVPRVPVRIRSIK